MRTGFSRLGLVLAVVFGTSIEVQCYPVSAQQADRVIWAGGAGQVEDVAISPDGRLLTYVDLVTKELYVRDLRTNQSRQVSKIAAAGGEVVESAISADGKLVAVASRVPGEGWGVRILELDPSSSVPPRLFLKGEVTPLQWSADGRRLLVDTSGPRGHSISLANVADGSVQPLKTASQSSNPNVPFASMSPDGSLLVYDTHVKRVERHRSIFVASIGGGAEVPVLDDGKWNSVLGWAPDGKSIIFFSDRSGGAGIWSVPVTEAGRAGEPRLLIQDFRGIPKGVTASGELFFGQQTAAPAAQIHLANIDADGSHTGRVTTFATGEMTLNRFPRWSADGKSFMYIAAHQPGAVLTIQAFDQKSEKPRQLPLNLAQVVTLDWATDKSAVVCKGTDFTGVTGVHVVNVETGQTRRIITNGAGYHPQFTPDGRAVQFFRSTNQAGQLRWAYVEKDLAGDAERVLHEDLKLLMSQPDSYPAGRSPDGRFLVAITTKLPASKMLALDTTTNTVRELFQVPSADAFNHNGGLTYTPDNRAIIATVPNPKDEQEIWWIPLDERKPHKIAIPTAQIAENVMAIHPNGRQIAFVAGRPVQQTVRLLPGFHYIGQPADFRLRQVVATK